VRPTNPESAESSAQGEEVVAMSNKSKKNSTPKYRLHKQSGRGIVTLPDGLGRRKDYILPGAYESAESTSAYHRLIAEWEEAGRTLGEENDQDDSTLNISVNELMLRLGPTSNATIATAMVR
jgi:hypothetical protein